MKKGLSKREKMLLFAVGLLVIIYLAIQFAIIPLADRYTTGVEERSSLTTERWFVDADISNLPSIRESNATASEQFEQIKLEYPLLIPNEEIDPILTNLCINNGLKPTSLNFTGSTLAPESENAEQAALFTIVSVTMTVTGNYNSILRLLDDVDSKQYMRITNLGYASNRQTETPDDSTITLAFELTFINP